MVKSVYVGPHLVLAYSDEGEIIVTHRESKVTLLIVAGDHRDIQLSQDTPEAFVRLRRYKGRTNITFRDQTPRPVLKRKRGPPFKKDRRQPPMVAEHIPTAPDGPPDLVDEKEKTK